MKTRTPLTNKGKHLTNLNPNQSISNKTINAKTSVHAFLLQKRTIFLFLSFVPMLVMNCKKEQFSCYGINSSKAWFDAFHHFWGFWHIGRVHNIWYHSRPPCLGFESPKGLLAARVRASVERATWGKV